MRIEHWVIVHLATEDLDRLKTANGNGGGLAPISLPPGSTQVRLLWDRHPGEDARPSGQASG